MFGSVRFLYTVNGYDSQDQSLRSYECQQFPTQFYNNDIVSGDEIIMR